MANRPCVDKSLIEKRVFEEETEHGLVLVDLDRLVVPLLFLQSNSHQCENRASGLPNYLRHICVWVENSNCLMFRLQVLIEQTEQATPIYEGFQTRFGENPGTVVN